MNAFVVKSWAASDSPDAQGKYIDIQGRAGGLVSWLLNLLEISPTVHLVVRADKISFEKGSLEGTLHFLTPMENTCSMFYAFKRPWKEALIGGTLIGLLTFFLFAIPGIAFAVLYYVLNKTLTIGFTDIGGHTREIPFKRSVLEGQVLDENEAAQVCDILQRLVDARRERALAIVN